MGQYVCLHGADCCVTLTSVSICLPGAGFCVTLTSVSLCLPVAGVGYVDQWFIMSAGRQDGVTLSSGSIFNMSAGGTLVLH